jgi:hypothetical protein
MKGGQNQGGTSVGGGAIWGNTPLGGKKQQAALVSGSRGGPCAPASSPARRARARRKVSRLNLRQFDCLWRPWGAELLLASHLFGSPSQQMWPRVGRGYHRRGDKEASKGDEGGAASLDRPTDLASGDSFSTSKLVSYSQRFICLSHFLSVPRSDQLAGTRSA